MPAPSGPPATLSPHSAQTPTPWNPEFGTPVAKLHAYVTSYIQCSHSGYTRQYDLQSGPRFPATVGQSRSETKSLEYGYWKRVAVLASTSSRISGGRLSTFFPPLAWMSSTRGWSHLT